MIPRDAKSSDEVVDLGLAADCCEYLKHAIKLEKLVLFRCYLAIGFGIKDGTV